MKTASALSYKWRLTVGVVGMVCGLSTAWWFGFVTLSGFGLGGLSGTVFGVLFGTSLDRMLWHRV